MQLVLSDGCILDELELSSSSSPKDANEPTLIDPEVPMYSILLDGMSRHTVASLPHLRSSDAITGATQ